MDPQILLKSQKINDIFLLSLNKKIDSKKLFQFIKNCLESEINNTTFICDKDIIPLLTKEALEIINPKKIYFTSNEIIKTIPLGYQIHLVKDISSISDKEMEPYTFYLSLQRIKEEETEEISILYTVKTNNEIIKDKITFTPPLKKELVYLKTQLDLELKKELELKREFNVHSLRKFFYTILEIALSRGKIISSMEIFKNEKSYIFKKIEEEEDDDDNNNRNNSFLVNTSKKRPPLRRFNTN